MKEKQEFKNSFLFKSLVTLIKIPLFILIAGLTSKPKEEPESIIDLYRKDPSLLEDSPARQRHSYENNDYNSK